MRTEKAKLGLVGARVLRRGSPSLLLLLCSLAPLASAFLHSLPSALSVGDRLSSDPITGYAPAKAMWRAASILVRRARHGNDDRNTDQPGEGVGWGVTGDDWFMTARMRYLREMERLGQELHDLSQAYNNGVAGNVPEGDALPPAPAPINEVALQEELRRQEIVVAERCAQNWREIPVFSKPVGFVPGGRKVQQVKLFNKRVMYGSDGGHVGLANTVDGKDIFSQQVHSALVTALDYDGSWMISAADDGLVVVYRETMEGVQPRLQLRLHSNRVVAAEILNHKLAMTASMDGIIKIFELETGKVSEEIVASDTLLCASVCKGYVFAGLMSGVCEAFSIRNHGRPAFRYISQRCPIRSLKTFPTANSIKVVTGGQDGVVRQFHVRPVVSIDVWKLATDRTIDDRLVLLCNTHVDQETSRESGDQGFVLKGHRGPVVAVACDEEKVVSASEDGSVTVWDAFKGTPAYSIRQHVDGDLVAAVDFNERYLVVDGTKGSVFVWDYSVGPPARRAPSSTSSGRAKSRGRAGDKKGRPSSSNTPRLGSGRTRGSTPPPPPPPPGLPFPFIGGWNLGHGPTDLNGGSTNSNSNNNNAKGPEDGGNEASEGDGATGESGGNDGK